MNLHLLGEVLYDLDKDDELYNCTAQLVLAAVAFRVAPPGTELEKAAREALDAALVPFLMPR